jgi:hypothetical protein
MRFFWEFGILFAWIKLKVRGGIMMRFGMGMGLAFFGLMGSAHAATLPVCTAAQLQVYEVAVDQPGMMKSYSLYGIINTSTTACTLRGTPTVVGLASPTNITIPATSQIATPAVVVYPLSKKDSVISTQLVWFAFQGNAASNGPTFKTIQVTLPGLADHPYTVAYSGYSTAVSGLTSIQQGAQNWLNLTGSDCPGFDGKHWPVFFTATAHCG